MWNLGTGGTILEGQGEDVGSSECFLEKISGNLGIFLGFLSLFCAPRQQPLHVVWGCEGLCHEVVHHDPLLWALHASGVYLLCHPRQELLLFRPKLIGMGAVKAARKAVTAHCE